MAQVENRRTQILAILVIAAWALCGAELPQEHQYKRITRNAIASVVQGNLEKAETRLREALKAYPDDEEALYGLALVAVRKGNVDSAIALVEKAVASGLPFDRFLAGPRDLFEPLLASKPFRHLAAAHSVEVIHGPMLGAVTENGARFWVRTVHQDPIQVFVSECEDMSHAVASDVRRTSRHRDYTAVVTVSGLRPDRRYFYQLSVNGERQPKTWSFRTFPISGAVAKFEVAFGGGAGYTPWHERMWITITAHHPLAFLFLGDNVYIDHPTMPAVQRYCYYRRQSRPEYRAFTASTCIFAIWDDHDFTTNDGWGGPGVDYPPWKRPVWRLFQENWSNPAYGGGQGQPGCWFSFSIADVDFFMLDCRYYRTDPKAPHPSMLGPVQKRWLLEKLKASKGTFKVLASSVPWAFGTKPGSVDTWDGYKQEREEIFSFIEKHRVEGIVLLSADRHRSDVWKIERANGYDFYEFESSKLTNVHTHRLMPGALFGYNEKCSFGLLRFDTTKPDPELTYQIINIDDQLVHAITLKRSQLSF